MNSLLTNSDLIEESGKTIRPFRNDLNLAPYDYKVEVTNILKGLDLIDRLPDVLWMEGHDIAQRQGSRPSTRKRNVKKTKWLSEGPYK